MEDKSLLMIVLAFFLGRICSGMMKQMCGGRLVEGTPTDFNKYKNAVASCLWSEVSDTEVGDFNTCLEDK